METLGLLPTIQAESIRRGLSEYLTTTFSLADRAAQQALDDFLTDPESGIFIGPFVRTRTPFKPVEHQQSALDITPGPHPPYGHQAAAFSRLSSKGLAPADRPQPTIVTTGTGSGKTEAFLYPILDHVRRMRRTGQTGMSALILYPMNALALDQAQRLADMLVSDPQFAGIRAGLYVGDSGDAKRSMVSAEGLITDRDTMRADPPDILLTNYKMLDRLLLKPADQNLFAASALSLQYLVLDEFHTYDGAQGTDVAMLLRRLGAALKRHWPDAHPRITDDHRERPLGRLTPVATSATLGDDGDVQPILDFAHAVFGEKLTADAIVTESRYTVAEWAGLTSDPLASDEPAIPGFPAVDLAYQDIAAVTADDALRFITADGPGLSEQIRRTAATLLTTPDRRAALACCLQAADAASALPELIRHHPAIHRLAAATTHARELSSLAEELHTTSTYLNAVLSLLSWVRIQAGREALTTDVHMWIRELTRIDRVAGGRIAFRWSDDGITDLGDEAVDDWADNEHRDSFPAVFCRNCGRSGWAVLLSPDSSGLDNPDRDATIRAASLQENERYRVLLAADGEAEQYRRSEPAAPDRHPFLADFRVRQRELSSPEDVFGPAGIRPELRDEVEQGDHLPVLADLTADGGAASLSDTCPACGERDSIRFLGAAIATLLSVSLSTLFSDSRLALDEKKSLVFTDSVQDAAHRAGFVESRSHTFSARSVLAAAAADAPSLAAVADVMLEQAGDDPVARYRLLAPELATERFPAVQKWWKEAGRTSRTSGAVRTGPARETVRRRLAFDAALEFGLQNRVGRTLELTGTVQAEVELPASSEIAALSAALFSEADVQTAVLPEERARIAWVRGVVEQLRMRGAIHHEWLQSYVAEGGRRYRIWGGRRRDQGMPAFPRGRPAPAFAYIGPKPEFDTEFMRISEGQSWFARYGARTLGIDRQHAAALTVQLLQALAQHDGTTRGPVRATAIMDRRGTAFGLEPASVRLGPTENPEHLACTVCRTDFPMAERARAELTGAPCLLVTCSGTLEPQPVADNFYRRLYAGADQLRIVAREHSSILDAEARKEVEDGFKRGGTDPSAANALVATPTLEMGIDIGDLSCVMLSSLPRTVANYVQRVGRAGRRTGNALLLAFANGHGRQRPMLDDPLATIEGAVRPPATYLDAVEIIRRQYTAFILDHLAARFGLRTGDHLGHGSPGAGDGIDEYPRSATGVFGGEVGTSPLLSVVIDTAETEAAELLDTFLSSFGEHIGLAADELRAWATPSEGTSGLRDSVHAAHRAFRARQDALTRRLQAITPEYERLKSLQDQGLLLDEDLEELRQVRSAWRSTTMALSALRSQDWVSALESAQLLPNYTLLDDTVDLDVMARWRDEDAEEWREESITFERGARAALRDFAPGAVFYGRGMQVRIDALDLGTQNEDVHTLALCPGCGYVHSGDHEPAGSRVPASCPRCGASGIADHGQRIQAVRFRRAAAMVNRDEAGIADREDDRVRRMFTVVSAADIDPSLIDQRWFTTGYDFGVTYLRQVRITTMNLGLQRRSGAVWIDGTELPASLFTVCASCGVLDRTIGANDRREHRPWCHLRDAATEDTVSVALTHELITQGALLRLPHDLITGDELTVPSFEAALRLGLREVLGGGPSAHRPAGDARATERWGHRTGDPAARHSAGRHRLPGGSVSAAEALGYPRRRAADRACVQLPRQGDRLRQMPAAFRLLREHRPRLPPVGGEHLDRAALRRSGRRRAR